MPVGLEGGGTTEASARAPIAFDFLIHPRVAGTGVAS
jgi:hypothetical protein